MTNILGWIVFAAIMAGIWGLFGEGLSASKIGRGDPLAVSFTEKKAAVTAIRITDVRGTMLLKLSGETWVRNAGGAVNSGAVQGLLDGLAASERREPKIGNTLRGARDDLESDDPTTLALMDASGKVIFAVTLGLHIPAVDGTSLTYALVDGEEKAWLVSHLPPLSSDPQSWAE